LSTPVLEVKRLYNEKQKVLEEEAEEEKKNAGRIKPMVTFTRTVTG